MEQKKKIISEETRKKISEALKGKKYPRELYPNRSTTGKKYKWKVKDFIPKNLNVFIESGKNTRFNKNIIPWNKGLTKETDERVKKYSENLKEIAKTGIFIPNSPFTKGHKSYTPEHLSEEQKRKIGIKNKEHRKYQVFPIKDTSIELKIQSFLKQLGIEYIAHGYMHIEHGYQCDILIPSTKTIIECDGNYWHKYPNGTEIDHIRTKELIEKGYRVIRLWEHEIKKMDLNQFQGKIL
ncbi:MAG: DUF559 domain-containing protein [Candidatus Pacearchaeota archaeon]|jgi:very-short-patch-repair endonuclease